MQKWILSVVSLILFTQAANAEIVQWDTTGKKISYGMFGAGLALSYSAHKSKTNEHFGSIYRLDAIGALITGAGALSLWQQVVTDIKQTQKNMDPEHRSLVRYSRALTNGNTVASNINFNEILTVFECSQCENDAQKSLILADLVQKAHELGLQYRNQEMTLAVEEKIQHQLEEFLGSNKTLRNNILIRYIFTQSYTAQ